MNRYDDLVNEAIRELKIKKQSPRPSGSQLENVLAHQIKLAGLPEPLRELRNAVPDRRYRFDFGWPDHHLLLEVQGGAWIRSGHTSGSGINRDTEKANLAMLEGWRVMCVTSNQIHDGRALQWIKRALEMSSKLPIM